MTAPRIRETKGAVYPDVPHQASAPFASRSHTEDSIDIGRRHNRLFSALLAQADAGKKRYYARCGASTSKRTGYSRSRVGL